MTRLTKKQLRAIHAKGNYNYQGNQSNIKIITVGKKDTRKNQVGIHLLNPTQRQIDDAVEDAENKMFPAVIIHRTI